MRPFSRICLILILLVASQLHGETIYAKPKQNFQVGYPIEARTLKIYPLTKIELHRQTNDAVFVSIEDDPTIIKLDRHGSDKRPLFELHGDLLKPLEMLHKEVDQGWMLFSQSTAYQVVEIEDGQLTLQFPREDGLINLKLSADYFDLHTKEAIAQTIKRAKAEAEQPRLAQTTTRNRPLNQTSNSRQFLSPEQRNHQAAENSLKAYLANQPVPFRITTEPTEAACIVENVRGSGSGFLGIENGRIYLFTNIHMLTSGGGGLKAKLVNGRRLQLGPIELAQDRDLARIAILTPNLPALNFDYAPQLGEAITAYGNSSGGNVITELNGKVLGIGPTEIEISAKVVHGNSGGPILNQSGQVLAVVTRGEVGSSSRMAQGTRFAQTRRFAARVDPAIRWEPASYRNLLDYEKAISDGQRELAEFKALDTLFSRDWEQGIREENLSSAELARWSKSHNNLLAVIGQIDDDDLRAEMASVSRQLSGLPHQRARYYQHFKLLPENTYYRDQLNEIAGKYDAYNDLGKNYAAAFAQNPPQSRRSSSRTTTSTSGFASSSTPIEQFQRTDKTQYRQTSEQAYCLAVCKGIRENNLVQLVFSFRPGASLITVDSYVNGANYSGTVTIVANGRRIDASRTLSLKDFSAMAKAFRREVHLGPQEWGDGYQMLGDRPLHQLIDYGEDHTQ